MQNNSKRIRVLFILTALHRDGAVLSTLTTIRHLDRARFDPKLFVLKNSGSIEYGTSWKVLLEDIDLSYGLQPSEKVSRHGYLLISRLYNLAKRSDIVIGGLEMMPTFLAVIIGKILGRPSVAFIRNSLPELLAGLPPYYKLFTKWIYPHLSRAVGISGGIQAGAGKLLPGLRDRISTVYIPIDLDQIRARSNEPLPESEALKPYLLAVGRLMPQKGFDLLLEAYSQARKEGLRQKLVIIGEGKEKPLLENLVAKLNLQSDVYLAGFQENPYGWMKNAELFVSSSRFEGFCRVLAEAQAVGTPVIATDCPEGPAEVLEGGRSGKLVKSEDPGELAKAMVALSNSPIERNQLSIRGLERVKEFDLPNTVRSFEEVLFKLTRPTSKTAKVPIVEH